MLLRRGHARDVRMPIQEWQRGLPFRRDLQLQAWLASSLEQLKHHVARLRPAKKQLDG